MKKYLIIIALNIGLFVGCSKDNTTEIDERFALKGIAATLGAIEESNGSQTKAISDFVVNTAKDPTSIMTNRYTWNFDIQIYKGNTPYQYGEASLRWNGSMWVPITGDSLYFPNYTRQGVAATLYPASWNGTVQVMQNTAALLLAQDILRQNGNATVTVNPAHIPTISMRHGNSMIDFILNNVDTTQITSVNVYVGSIKYTPYKVPGLNRAEYMVILPVGSRNPEVRLVTNGGAEYIQQLSINPTQINVCYCVKLSGLELLLSSVTVTDWLYGTALPGDYSTTTSYPTFKGPVNDTITLIYHNGLQQSIIFNSRGEYTLKPFGRRIDRIQLTPTDGFNLNPPIILHNMFIDLNPRIDSRT